MEPCCRHVTSKNEAVRTGEEQVLYELVDSASWSVRSAVPFASTRLEHRFRRAVQCRSRVEYNNSKRLRGRPPTDPAGRADCQHEQMESALAGRVGLKSHVASGAFGDLSARHSCLSVAVELPLAWNLAHPGSSPE